MEPVHYLKILWRRWPIIAACVAVAIIPAWTAEPAPAGRAVRTFVATHTLIRDLDAGNNTGNYLATAALLTTTGEVPRQAAKRLNFSGDPAILAAQVQATAEREVGSLAIKTTNPDGTWAAAVANAFATELMAHLAAIAEQTRQRAVDQTAQNLKDLQLRVQELDAAIAEGGRGEVIDLVRARRDAQVRQYGVTFSRLQQLADTDPGMSNSGFVTLQEATPVPIVQESFRPPSSRPGRLATAVVVGFVVGSGIALVREQASPRLRSRRAAEEAFELPTLTEVPRAGGRHRGELAVIQAPLSPTADAYRTLRTSLRHPPARSNVASPDAAAWGSHGLDGQSLPGEPRTILVTSAGEKDGKTTTVANLAAVLAEAGRSVVVVDANLRHPRLHEIFGLERGPGLLDVLQAGTDIASAVRPTGVAGIQILTAGTPVANPAEVLPRDPTWLQRVRLFADVVLIDTGPLLGSNEASDLLPLVDLVILANQLGRTRPDTASRTSEFLARAGVPVLGLVTFGSRSSWGFAQRYRRAPAPPGEDYRGGPLLAANGDGPAPPRDVPPKVERPSIENRAVNAGSPGLTTDPRLCDDRLRAVAAYGLPGVTGLDVGAPLPPAEWRAVLAGAVLQRVTGLLLAAIEDGALATTEDQRAEAVEAQVTAMGLVLRLERTLIGVARMLTEHGVDLRVLKGSTLAHLDYPDPSHRSFVDIDILVRSEQWDTAARLLTEAGHERLYPEPRSGFDRRFSKGTTFRTAERFEIDLHRTFVLGPFGLTIDLGDVWAGTAQLELGGYPIHALDRELRFLNVCAHAALGDVPPRLVPLRDIAQIHLMGAEDLDVDRVVRLAEHWRAEIVLARGIRLCWDILGLHEVTPLTDWADRFRADRRQQRALGLYLDRRETYVALLLGTTRVVPGVRNKLSYLSALAFPDQQFVEGRYRSRGGRWKHAAAVGRRWRRPSRTAP